MRVWAIAAAAITAAFPAQAQSQPPSAADAAGYRACIAEVERSAHRGFEYAIGWESLGGGDPARHCVAVALMRLGHHEVAARRFEELARVINADAAVKADLLGQSGQAWLRAENPTAALAVLDAAISLDDRNPEIFTDRAQAHAEGGDMGPAIEDLSRRRRTARRPGRFNWIPNLPMHECSALVPTGRPARRGWPCRTWSWRSLGTRPIRKQGTALLERGILRGRAGDDAGARADWLRVIEVAPDGPAATAAQANLERMDGPR